MSKGCEFAYGLQYIKNIEYIKYVTNLLHKTINKFVKHKNS